MRVAWHCRWLLLGLLQVRPCIAQPATSAGGSVASVATARSQTAASSSRAGAENLLIDLRRIVTTQEGSGWFLDEEEYREIYTALLESVCRSTEAARQAALRTVHQRAAAAGEPRAVFDAEGGRVTSRFEEALSTHRERIALDRAVAGAAKDCPFWIAHEPDFLARQTDHSRFTLNVETGGNIQLRRTAGRWTFGGGGLGRILPGYGVGEHLSLLAGIEFGGGAMLRPGGPETEFVINYFPAIPVVLRFRDVNWRYDVEFGPVGLFQADNTRLSYGGRIGTTIGVLALRTRGLIPWAGIAATYEYYVASGGRPEAHFLRGGLRVGVIWDP